jgi:hypothetical protein
MMPHLYIPPQKKEPTVCKKEVVSPTIPTYALIGYHGGDLRYKK